jgi:hypothetical protein
MKTLGRTYRHTDKQGDLITVLIKISGGHTDRETNKQTDRQRQTDRHQGDLISLKN